jgi:hypothetical protein
MRLHEPHEHHEHHEHHQHHEHHEHHQHHDDDHHHPEVHHHHHHRHRPRPRPGPRPRPYSQIIPIAFVFLPFFTTCCLGAALRSHKAIFDWSKGSEKFVKAAKPKAKNFSGDPKKERNW